MGNQLRISHHRGAVLILSPQGSLIDKTSLQRLSQMTGDIDPCHGDQSYYVVLRPGEFAAMVFLTLS
jgi:hypothetical protein